MTAANEKPITCPCCGNSSVTQWPSDIYEYECNNCACLWDETKRRAQPAEGADEAKEREAFELYCKSEHLCTERAYRDPEYYAERNTAFAWYAWLARARDGK